MGSEREQANVAVAARVAPRREKSNSIADFHAASRVTIRALTQVNGAFRDLIDSFPALLFAFATGYGTPERRKAATRLIIEGAPLRDAAEALGLPIWLRAMPPWALSEPLRSVPDGDHFVARIHDFIPSIRRHAEPWLRSVLYAAEACHTEFALWIARHLRNGVPIIATAQLPILSAWAWHTSQPATPGYALLRRPWTSDYGLMRALDDSRLWSERAALTLALGPGLGDTWIEDGAMLGFEFVALRTPADFIDEATAMSNCLDRYGHQMSRGLSRVFSVRRDGAPVADVEISLCDPQGRTGSVPIVTQLRGSRNRVASHEVWRATYAWLGSRPLRMLQPAPPSAIELRQRRRAFWGAYLAALPDGLRAKLTSQLVDTGSQRVRPRLEPPPR